MSFEHAGILFFTKNKMPGCSKLIYKPLAYSKIFRLMKAMPSHILVIPPIDNAKWF